MAESDRFYKKFSALLDINFSHIKTLCYEQERIKSGNYFSYSAFNSALGNSSYIFLQIETPTSSIGTISLHEIYVNNSGGLFELLAIQSPTTFTSGTTPVTFTNRNFNSTNTALFTSYNDPSGVCLSSTITSTQSQGRIIVYLNSTGTNQSIGNSGITFGKEYILKYNTTYVLKVTNLSGGTCYNSVRYHFFHS